MTATVHVEGADELWITLPDADITTSVVFSFSYTTNYRPKLITFFFTEYKITIIILKLY